MYVCVFVCVCVYLVLSSCFVYVCVLPIPLQVFDKAVDEPSYSCMYAQLCLRLNEFAPNFEEAGSQTTVSAKLLSRDLIGHMLSPGFPPPQTFRKLLLHKCHEEFEKRKKANAGGWSL